VGIEGGVAAPVEGDLSQLLAGEPELVHAPLPYHGDPVGRRDGAVGERPLQETTEARHPPPAATHAADALPAPGALRRALSHRAVHQDVARQSGRHREAGGDDRAQLARALAPAVVPVEGKAERVLHLGRGGSRKTGRPRPHARVGGEAVDVVALQAGIGNGGERRLHGEVEVGAPHAPADLRLPDARNDGAPFQWFRDRRRAHDASRGATGRKSGM
jgi:hypothetical protein